MTLRHSLVRGQRFLLRRLLRSCSVVPGALTGEGTLVLTPRAGTRLSTSLWRFRQGVSTVPSASCAVSGLDLFRFLSGSIALSVVSCGKVQLLASVNSHMLVLHCGADFHMRSPCEVVLPPYTIAGARICETMIGVLGSMLLASRKLCVLFCASLCVWRGSYTHVR